MIEPTQKSAGNPAGNPVGNPGGNPAGLSIRIFIYPQDYPAVYALWENAGPGIHLRLSDEPQEIEKKLKRDPDLFLVAELDGRIVGSVLGGFDGRRGMMYHLAVDPSHRQNGIGALLMDELERRLRDRGCIRYYLLVTQDNEAAIRFYEGRGWTRMDLFAYGKDLV
jgi:ribosomal protein S18 acetylase RimI-like enzyme